jgi:hemerythrin-like domain-containing protein
MLRNPNLAPLSRQHQHALALCVRIDRAGRITEPALPDWQQEIEKHFESEIKDHFAAEERLLFPATRKFPELAPMVDELLADHQALRSYFTRAVARKLNPEDLRQFAAKLSRHIRREERELFEGLQQRMTTTELDTLGSALSKVLAQATQSCSLPRSQARESPGTSERASSKTSS